MASTEQQFISREDEADLALRYQSGDQDALESLLEAHAGYVRQISWRWHQRVGRWFEFEDCFQEAVIGAIVATKKFRPSEGVRWTTYATWWMLHYLRRMRRNCSVIKVPANVFTDPLFNRLWDLASIDVPFDDSEKTRAETLVDRSNERSREIEDAMESLSSAVDRLRPRDKDILMKRLSGRIFDDIAGDYKISKERVRQIEERAIKELALAMNVKNVPVASIDLQNIRHVKTGGVKK